jgi:hypothetical protein
MAKTVHDSVLDGAFDILDQADLMTVCDTQPTTFAEATTNSGGGGFKLADVAMTPDTDFTKSNGDVSGRKVRMAAKSGVPIDVSGTAIYIALTKAAGSVLLYVTTCTSQALTAGGTVDFPVWDIEIADPT